MTRKGAAEVCTASPASDSAVIAQVLDGDIDAFAILFRRHRNPMFRYALRMLGNREDAEDALQEAFVRAYRALPACGDPERFGGWLFRILVNRCRTRSARARRYEAAFVDDTTALERAAAPAPAETADDPDPEIVQALARLSPDQREAFLLKHVEDRSYDEMVTITGAGVSALKMRVRRAIARLKDLLLGEGGTCAG